MSRYSRASRILLKGTLINIQTRVIFIIILISCICLIFNTDGNHTAELAVTSATNICVLFNIALSGIKSGHPVFGAKYEPGRMIMTADTKKIHDTIYMLPFSRKEILKSYITSVTVMSIPLFISMTAFAVFSAAHIYDTQTCITGNLLFIFNTFLLPVKSRHLYENSTLHALRRTALIILACFLTDTAAAAVFSHESHTVSLIAGITGLLAEIRAVILMIKYNKKLLETSCNWSVSGEPTGKEKKNA